MSKIKINLTSGNLIEKPLVTAFKAQMGNYIILDNEANGSMGLPIICVSKFNGTNAEKIADQNEWGQVKECLKTIIGGTNLEYITVPESISATDDFFTQLTLPLASFDVLKNTYAPAVAPAPEVAPVAPAPVVDAPQAPAVSEPAIPESVSLTTPVTPTVATSPFSAVGPMPAAPTEPVIPTIDPVISVAPTMPEPVGPIVPPTVETTPITPAPVTLPESQNIVPPVVEAPVAPVIDPATSVIAPASQDFSQMKETFLKSCENMFDALVKEFQNK